MADEPVIVVDIGSSCVKAGWAGEDTPSIIIPSTITEYPKYTHIIEPVSDLLPVDGEVIDELQEPFFPVNRGLVKDWDSMSKLWDIIRHELGITSFDGHSIMIVESPRATSIDRENFARVLFDTCRVTSICIGNSSSLCVFASGRTTGLAVDCGAGVTTAVPVFEGLALKHAAMYMDYGGQDITFNLRKQLASRGVNASLADIRQMKENLAFVSVPFDCPATSPLRAQETTPLSLPDGTEVSVPTGVLSSCTESFLENQRGPACGLSNQVFESLHLLDASIRGEFMKNIILAGGNSLLPGLGDRVAFDVQEKLSALPSFTLPGSSPPPPPSPGYGGFAGDLLVIPNSYYRESGYTSQRRVAGWIGGSIVGCMETYRSMKITRQEYEESRDIVLRTKSF